MGRSVEDGHEYLNGLSQEELAEKFENASAAVDIHMGIMLACMARMDICTDEECLAAQQIKNELSAAIATQ